MHYVTAIVFVGLALTVWLEPFQFLYGLPPAAVAFLCLPIVTTGMTLGLLFLTGLAWRNRYWSVWERMYYTLVTRLCCSFYSLPALLESIRVSLLKNVICKRNFQLAMAAVATQTR